MIKPPKPHNTCIQALPYCEAECCKYILIPWKEITPEIRQYIRTRGWKLVGNTAMASNRCPMLTPENKCKIHYRNKPEVCKKSGYHVSNPNCPYLNPDPLQNQMTVKLDSEQTPPVKPQQASASAQTSSS